MNYLLVMPRFGKVGDGYAFPNGIPYISAYLKSRGICVYTLNLNHIEGNIGDILTRYIEKYDIRCFMTGGLSGNFVSLKTMCDYVKRNYPHITTIVGGGVITADPPVSMTAFETVDIGVIGEGELTNYELAERLNSNLDIRDVKGIIYRNGDGWTQTEAREEIENLDSLPFPDYDGFGLDFFLNSLPPPSINQEIKPRTAFVVGSRNCCNLCTFCFHTTGYKYRQRSIDNIMKEIILLKEKYGIECVRMSDELFAMNKERVREFSRRMKEINMPWLAFFRVDCVDDELISIIKDSTCLAMNYGVESLDETVLKSMRKNITVAQIENALKKTFDAGIPLSGNLIFGDIAETLDTAKKTLDWWEAHPHYNLTLRFIVVYPGTYLYRYAVKKGIIPDPVAFLKAGCPQVNVSGLTDDELSYLAKRIIRTAQKGLAINDRKTLSLDSNGRLSMSGTCSVCGTENSWNHIKTFANNNWCRCVHCNSRLLIEFPDDLHDRFLKNARILVDFCRKNRSKAAFWGVTSRTLDFFEDEAVFSSDTALFIDTSFAKRHICINGRQVKSPERLSEGDVLAVVCCYPNRMETVKRLCPPHVKILLFAHDLLQEDFVLRLNRMASSNQL